MKTRLLRNSLVFTLVFLCLSWALLVIMRSSDSDISFSVLANRYGLRNLRSPKSGEYMSGETIIGEFTAREDNLGIVSVRLNVDHVVDADKVIFRLKEKERSDWYYVNRYRITKLPGTRHFPFGFPIIPSSGGRVYRFEIEIVRGVPGDAIMLDTTYPAFEAHYKFYKKDLLGNPRNFVVFLAKKVAYYFSNPRTLVSSFVALLAPLAVWAAARAYYKKWPLTYATVFLVIFLPLFQTLFTVKTSEAMLLILTGVILAPLLYLKLDSSISFFFAFAYLVFTSVLFFVGDEHAIQTSAIWGFMFLLIGLFQSYWELNHRRKKLVGLKTLFSRD